MEIDDELGIRLHDRATRSQPLSAEEQEQLQTWYDEKDREEAEMLRASRAREAAEDQSLARINATLTTMESLIKRIGEVEAENELLRQEIALLRGKLTDQVHSQAA